MAVQIVQDFVPDDWPIRSHLPMAAKYISIHETANVNRTATDEMHAKYIKSPDALDRTVLWHFTCDDDSITQHLPVNEVGWHAGDGQNGPGNRQSIAIELCVNEGSDFAKTQANAAWLIAKLYCEVPTLLPFPDGVVQHNKWSGKDCPHILRSTKGGWEKFMSTVKDALNPPWNPADEIARLKVRGIINGDHNPNALPTYGELATIINRVMDRVEGK